MRTATKMMLIALATAGTAAAQPTPKAQTFQSITITGRGQLGFTALEISDELRAYFGAPKDAGVLVDRLQPDRPAAKAGLHVGDVVIAVDGKAARGVGDLIGEVSRHEKGDTVALDLVRGGKRMTLRATLDADAPAFQSMRPMFDQRMFDPQKMLDQKMFDARALEEMQKRMEQMEQRLQKLERT